MNHNFDVNIAKKLGLEEAIILNNLCFWIQKNKANNTHFYDGKHWTYNSVKAFNEMFPYWTPRQIDRILKSLEAQGAIFTGNYNKSNYDRTKWYAVSDNVYSMYAKSDFHFTETQNGNTEIVEPIPYVKQYNKQDKNTDNMVDIFFKDNDEEKGVLLKRWINYRIEIKKKLSKSSIDSLIKKFNEYEYSDCLLIIETSINNGWIGLFWDKINNKKSNQTPESRIQTIAL